MRFGNIVSDFYRIKLSPLAWRRVDAHFRSASSYYFSALNGIDHEERIEAHIKMWQHIAELHRWICTGDFTNLLILPELSLRGFPNAEAWRPEHILRGLDFARLGPDPRSDLYRLPDKELFVCMEADAEFGSFSGHVYDLLLEDKNLDPAHIILIEAAS